MPRHRLTLVCAAVMVSVRALAAPAAQAGILIEGTYEGTPLRAELGRDRARVLVAVAGRQRLVDLATGQIWVATDGTARPLAAALADDGVRQQPWRLEAWGQGPSVAGYASSYNVLQLGERICAEVLASRWMIEFVDPVVQAISLLQRIEPALRPKPRPGCGAVPFEVYARNGWPLLAGYRDGAIFRTKAIRFDHAVDPARLRLEGEAENGEAGS